MLKTTIAGSSFVCCLLGLFSGVSGMADPPDFAHDVVPILKKHCAECHTGEKSEGGFSFNTLRLLKESGHTTREDGNQARLIELIVSQDPDDQMPPQDRPRLSDRETEILKQWVLAETPWEPGFRFAATGYEPPLLPRPVTLPPPAYEGQNPIDRILTPYYAEQGVDVPSAVPDHVFLRRVYMDLIGLPPEPAEQDEFLNRSEADGRQQLIDRLLSRDRDYAEHWMAFWNDLLRNDYAGTGYIDGGRRQITAWLYDALVTNKPYDQFVQELIAPTAESEGFINGIKWRGNVNASQVREIQFAQNVAQVFLGINMKCASCHDSFIDRWTLDEAYGLAAVYSTRELEIHRCDKPTGRVAQAAWIFPELGEVDAAAEQPERLRQLADLMTSANNGRFSRTIVNRLWHRLMGRGIVHPVDAMHTRPWNAELLEYLAGYLVEQNYDLKSVLRLIATSDAYRAQAAPAQDSATSEEFVFRGPQARHLTAEQFMDAVWRLTESAPRSIQAPIPLPVYYGESFPQVDLSGQWIWSHAEAATSPAGETAAFHTVLSLKKTPQQALLVLTCDNEYTAFVNRKKVGADGNWPTVEAYNIGQHLKPGDNQILIVAKNAGDQPNPAGLYAEIVLTDTDGDRTRVATNQTWRSSRQIPASLDLSTVTWEPAVPLANQDFLGPSAAAAIRTELGIAMLGQRRPARATLLKSNLLMRSLGRPNREQVVTTRPASLSTLQAIDLANGEILDDMLATGARRLLSRAEDRDALVRSLFQTALCREPAASERRLVMEILGAKPTTESVQDVLWLLVMLPEFQFVQ
ncbi:MAG: DUF1549 domain-containing protein [Fuerstiella sp.]